MSSEYSEEENSLRQRVDDSERVLGDFTRELDAANDELEQLVQKRHQYDVLAKVCQSVEELDHLDAGDLFWALDGRREDSHAYLSNARGKIKKFAARITEVEQQRQGVLDKIDSQNRSLDDLHYDLEEILEEQEARDNEWLVEREPAHLPAREQVMPWSRGNEEDQRFRRSLGASIAAAVAVAVIVGSIAIPIVQQEKVTELPERVAKLVRQELALPPPPPPLPEPILPEEPLEPELTKDQPPESEPVEQVAEAPEPSAKEKVKSKGILAFRDSFVSRANLRPTAQLGAQARISTAGATAVGLPTRSMVATSAPGSSGGINLAAISRNVGGGEGLEGVDVTEVVSAIAGAQGPDRPLSTGRFAGRTDEEIQIVFDRYKAALYRLYNRALRADPTLRGQLVLRLTIEPDGSVSLCQLHNSDMDAPTLAEQVVNRVAGFDFGAKEDIVAMTIIYPIDFLPAA